MNLDAAERQLLTIVGELEVRSLDWESGKVVQSTRNALLRRGELLLGTAKLNWDAAFDSLVRRGLLVFRSGSYFVADAAQDDAKRLRRELASRVFGDRLVRAATSPTYREYCTRVFGPGLFAFSLIDAQQIAALVDALALSPDKRCLDVGCAVGTLSQHVAQVTGAHVTGIDIASGAIELAQERYRDDPRLSFECVDANDLSTFSGPFDAVMAIDSIYFVDDLNETVAGLRRLLRPGGRLVVLASDVLPEDRSEGPFPAEQTRLGRVLARQGFEFWSTSFSDNEQRLWERQVAAVEALAGGFEAEGNQELLAELLREGVRTLEWCRRGRVRRFLYAARPSGPA